MTKDDSFFINLGSLTLAHKAQKILAENSVSATVGKSARAASGGCSWGLYVKGRKKEEVTLLLRAYSINPL
ncbi:MAG: hypothetical protein IJ323_01120 [Clostridia bacterium]|nr:hypothetical protein [Clostridia bacterium]